MADSFINRARIRFLSEECGSEAWGKIIRTLFANHKNDPSKKNSFTELISNYFGGDFVDNDSIYIVGSNANKAIYTFDTKGNLKEKRDKKLFFDFEFNKRKLEIIVEGNLQIRHRASDLVLDSADIADYLKSNPSEDLKLLYKNSFQKKFPSIFYDEGCFKTDCYALGADVVLNYSVLPDKFLHSYVSNFEGNLYKRVQSVDNRLQATK